MPILRALEEWDHGHIYYDRTDRKQTLIMSLAFTQLTHYIWLR